MPIHRDETPAYSQFLSLVSFVSSITFSIAVAASQQFATAQTLFGNPIQPNSELLNKVQTSSKFFIWGASLEAASLMLALVLQLVVTDEEVVSYDRSKSGLVVKYVGYGSWFALLLIASGLALMGEGLKCILQGAGEMIEWSILVFGLPTLLLYAKLRVESNHARRHVDVQHELSPAMRTTI